MKWCDELQYERLGDANKTYPASTLVIRKQFVDAAIAELKRENERLVKCCKEYDIRQRIDERIKFNGAQQLRATKRALWLARAARAQTVALLWNAYYYENNYDNCLYYSDYMTVACNPFRNCSKKTALEWSDLWDSVEAKCRAKAEEYK